MGTGALLYKKLNQFINKHRDTIEREFPRHWRRASGYSLNYMTEEIFNPAKLLAGSEGTLALQAEFTLGLVEVPNTRGLSILQFRDVREAMEAVASHTGARPFCYRAY